MDQMDQIAEQSRRAEKFSDPEITLDGSRRASVELERLDTLWFNTGTLCNLECEGCYIESSPRNDRLVYITLEDVAAYLDEIERDHLPVREIGLTGGEPFMNPSIMEILTSILERGFEVLVLTNAMTPMRHHREHLLALKDAHGRRLKIRVSMDHFTKERHEELRGPGAWRPMLNGLKWLSDQGFNVDVAGRTLWGEREGDERAGYGRLFECEGINVDADNPTHLVLFPEMDGSSDVPEITTACWDLLGVNPKDMMCATSRMVVREKGDSGPRVSACTLLPYEDGFQLGRTLKEAMKPVKLNHRHCAKFCVLGGGACSVSQP